MADTNDSMLDKAESLARRILERLGSKVDSKLGSSDQTLSPSEVGALTSRIERVIEASRNAPEWRNPLWRHRDGSVAEW